MVVRTRETARYLMFDSDFQLVGWKNFANSDAKISRSEAFDNANPFAFSGIQIVQPEIFQQITEEGKFPIMDLYLRLAKTEKITGFVDNSSLWMDLGKPDQLILAEKILATKG